MANNLTGDFDVVAEFTLDTANRVLAAMHSGNRLPHSWSVLVDAQGKQVVRSGTDVFGDAVPDPRWLTRAPAAPKRPSNYDQAPLTPLDPLANAPEYTQAPGVLGDPSHLKGIAQLQFGAPTLSLPGDSDTSAKVTLHTTVRARYIPDLQTMVIPEFMRGEFQIDIGVQEAVSPAGPFVNVFFGGNASLSTQPLPAAQSGAVQLALSNSLKNSFQPSTTSLPDNVVNIAFKTFPADSALAILMNTNDGSLAGELLAGLAAALVGSDLPGGPSLDSVGDDKVFLGPGDDFVLVVSGDLFQPKISAFVDYLETRLVPPVTLYTIHIDSTKVEFLDPDPAARPDGQILVTINGGADTDQAGLPNIGFTITQAFKLVPATSDSNGHTADLAADGPPGVAALSTGEVELPGSDKIVAFFKSAATIELQSKLPGLLTQINSSTIEPQLSADRNLGDFLTRLMNQQPKPNAQPEQTVYPQLAYTRCEVRSSGLVLHGTLQAATSYTPTEITLPGGLGVQAEVPAWPPVHVEFAQVNDSTTVPWLPPTFSALNSWIPGGTIEEFVWNLYGDPQPHSDEKTFVFAPAFAPGLRQLCLTINGTRLSATTPNSYDNVSTTLCGSTISIDLPGGVFSAENQGGSSRRPNLALAQFAASGGLEVVGHIAPWASQGGANLIVHFPDQHSVTHLDFLTRALEESKRTDTAAGIVVVLAPDQLSKVKPAPGIMFTDDDVAWTRLLKVAGRPSTFVIGTTGKVTWHHHGQLTSADLAATLKKYLAAGAIFIPRMLQSSVRIGQPTPNFLFQYAPSKELTLRKLAGRPVVLVFWTSSSQPSLQTLRDLQKTAGGPASHGPILLAINDGETSEIAKNAASTNGISATVIPDGERQISRAYGVEIWPTTILLDAAGIARGIRYGRFAEDLTKYATPGK